MPTYTCPKCARIFKQKSHYTDHMNKKTDCLENTALNAVIESKVEEKVKEAIRSIKPVTQITKETLPAFFEDLHNLLWNKAGLNPERALEHMTFFFAYRLIEEQADVLGLPQECRWSYIASIKNENDLFESIKKGVNHFRKPGNVTRPFFKPHEIQKAEIVYEIVQQIAKITPEVLKETDTLGDIFEYMLGRGMGTMSDEGQYFTNRKICALAFKLAFGIKQTLRRADGRLCTFADWFCGTGGFPAEYIRGVNKHLPDVNWKEEREAVYCQDMNVSSITTTLLNMLVQTGIPFSEKTIRSSNSFTDPITRGTGAPYNGLEIDYCFMNPPYGGDKTKGKEYKFAYTKKVKGGDGKMVKRFYVNEDIQTIGIEDDDKVSAGVQLGMATLASDCGVCAIVLPQGFFFGASKKCVELRKKIAEEYKIHYVVDIASGAFVNTGTKTSMLVFQKGVGATEKVAFIGLDESLLVEASLEELRKKNYSLNYKQYLAQDAVEVEGFTNHTLKDVCTFKRGTMITKSNLTPGQYPVIGGGLSPMGLHSEFNRPENTILVSQSGENAGHISKYAMPVWASDCFSIESNTILLNNHYLYHILKSNEKKIKELKVGTAQPHVYPSTIENLQIPLPSIERQQQIVEAIDGWMTLAHQEEQALKTLEKQVMFQVKEMGRGKERVKLGDIASIGTGKNKTPDDKKGTLYPYYGTSGITGYTDHFLEDGDYIMTARNGTIGNTFLISGKTYPSDHMFVLRTNEKCMRMYLYYWMISNKEIMENLANVTTIPGITKTSLISIEIPLPPLEEQQTLQEDFDEIKHKHTKIATYKAKAQEAIQRLIPGAT